MSEESTTPDLVELTRRSVEAANRRDLDAVASSFAEDATLVRGLIARLAIYEVNEARAAGERLAQERG
jgi:hypothetical protein